MERGKTKFIFVTGGVVSSLGKGLAAASLGALLEARGLRVTLLKHYSHPASSPIPALRKVHSGRAFRGRIYRARHVTRRAGRGVWGVRGAMGPTFWATHPRKNSTLDMPGGAAFYCPGDP